MRTCMDTDEVSTENVEDDAIFLPFVADNAFLKSFLLTIVLVPLCLPRTHLQPENANT